MKRIALLIATNFAVVLLLSAVIQVFHLDNYLVRRGLDYQQLLIFSAVLGFGGAFISLAISKWMAKRAMGVQVITQPASESERWLVATVRSHAEKAGIGMPEVGAVLGHEVAHVANGDMVTLTLIQGVLNTFVFFLARVIGSIVDGLMRG